MFSFLQRNAGEAVIRPLTTDDWADLEAMIATDPLAFLYAAEHLEHFGLPAPSALNVYRNQYGFMGIFAPTQTAVPLANSGIEDEALLADQSATLTDRLGEKLPQTIRAAAGSLMNPLSHLLTRSESVERGVFIPGQTEALEQSEKAEAHSLKLVGAFWLGANCVPLVVPERYRGQVAAVIGRASRNIASIFGVAEDVLPLWRMVQNRMAKPLSVRENQPLLYLSPETDLSAYTSRPLYRPEIDLPQLVPSGARWARTSDRTSLLKASVAMFTEEVGYDPLSRDPAGYARRIDEFIRTGRSVVATNREGIVVFKADLGLAHADICQVQGVWVHPAYRGLGLSEPLLAQAFELIRPRFPHISLYVNDYNTRARRLYEALGMQQETTFSTVLF